MLHLFHLTVGSTAFDTKMAEMRLKQLAVITFFIKLNNIKTNLRVLQTHVFFTGTNAYMFQLISIN